MKKFVVKKLTDGLHCRACDAQLGEKAYDSELCNTCIEVVWGLLDDIEQPDDFYDSIEPLNEEEHF